ncbi:hypothetical protein D3OALGB2SA_4571 [Olavius algarvensis associated proteobacterium Delta 3]|nr:hypothetical protein D3OALGB2SA_4571 [Olavius algarvensis associated proteobacterium Delta 3]
MLLGPFPGIPLSGILGKIQFLCVLCDSAVIVSLCLQTEHIYDNHYKALTGADRPVFPGN